LANDTTPTLGEAIDLVPASEGKAIGLFQLNQITDPTLFPGLKYNEQANGNGTTRTWTFDVKGHEQKVDPDEFNEFPFAELLYELVPANVPETHPLFSLAQQAQKFCDPSKLGVTGVQPILDPNKCKALFGLQMPVMASDYPANPSLGLLAGEVFTFSTLTKNGVEKALGFSSALCHTTRFVGPKVFDVLALRDSSNIIANAVTGTPLDTEITDGTFFVTVQPNDLWNSGANPRWSNADGHIDELSTVPFTVFDPVSGMNYLDQLDPEVAAFFAPNAIPSVIGNQRVGPTGNGFTAPFGALVGNVGQVSNSSDFRLLGTNAMVTVGFGERLKLFYWDTFTPDNTGSVEVTVAEDSIQCAVDDTPIVSQGDVRGNTVVDIVYNPTLNVDNKSKTANYPTTIVGCADYDPSFVIQSNGSPIINGTAANTQVLVNGTPVTLTGFHVANTISRPSCDNGQALPDLKLDLNRLSLINAVAPGGQCTNGLNSFKLEIGSATNGWFGGTSTMTLSHCD
jgi:hypothetical protein